MRTSEIGLLFSPQHYRTNEDRRAMYEYKKAVLRASISGWPEQRPEDAPESVSWWWDVAETLRQESRRVVRGIAMVRSLHRPRRNPKITVLQPRRKAQ